MKQKTFQPPTYTLLRLLLKSHYYICGWKLLPNKKIQKNQGSRGHCRCLVPQRFRGEVCWARGGGLACELSVHMDALNPFLSVSVMFGNK